MVTVNVYIPSGIPVIVVVVPVPVLITEPGVLLTVHVPVEGNPMSTTLPVDDAQVGCVTDSILGSRGIGGCSLITTLPDAADVHPAALVTVNV